MAKVSTSAVEKVDPLKNRFSNLLVYLGQIELAIDSTSKSLGNVQSELDGFVSEKQRTIEELRILQSIIDSRDT